MKKQDNKYTFPLPQVVRIEPSGVCNFRCRHCSVGLGLNKSVGLLTKSTFEEIYRQIKDWKIRVVVLYHGGEPFLSDQVFHYINKMSKISKMVKLNSNGSLLTDETIDKILKSSLNLIEFSLDGNSPQQNNSIRVGSNYEKISKQIIKFLEKRKISGSKIQVMIHNVQIPNKGQNLNEIQPAEYITKTFKKWLDQIKIQSYYSYVWPGYPRKKTAFKKPTKNYCDSIENTITIRWNGDVVPCCFDITSKMVMGNMLKTPLADIWNNQKYQTLRKQIAIFKPPFLCSGCSELNDHEYIYSNELPPVSQDKVLL